VRTFASEEPLCPKNVRTGRPLPSDCRRLLRTA